MNLKAGFFWYYLEPQAMPIRVEVDGKVPCRAFGKSDLMFRVLAEKNKISVEFSHILTDGTGEFRRLIVPIADGPRKNPPCVSSSLCIERTATL